MNSDVKPLLKNVTPDTTGAQATHPYSTLIAHRKT